jgi:hypothetical protein
MLEPREPKRFTVRHELRLLLIDAMLRLLVCLAPQNELDITVLALRIFRCETEAEREPKREQERVDWWRVVVIAFTALVCLAELFVLIVVWQD